MILLATMVEQASGFLDSNSDEPPVWYVLVKDRYRNATSIHQRFAEAVNKVQLDGFFTQHSTGKITGTWFYTFKAEEKDASSLKEQFVEMVRIRLASLHVE